MSNEDRELQIGLAQLQTDVQIYLTSFFGLLGICMAIAVGFVQVALSLPPNQSVQKLILGVCAIASLVVAQYYSRHYIEKIKSARKEVDKLKARYVW